MGRMQDSRSDFDPDVARQRNDELTGAAVGASTAIAADTDTTEEQ